MAWTTFSELRKRFTERQRTYAHLSPQQLEGFLTQLDEMLRNEDRAEAATTYLEDARLNQARRVVQLAMKWLGTAHAELNVITASQQITLAGTEEGKTIDAENGWCRNVVALADTLAITDADSHVLVMHTEVAQQGQVVSYLGAPVRAEGFPVGALCVYDERSRQWTEEDARRLEMLAGVISDSVPR